MTGAEIRELRQRLGVPQGAFATRLGVTREHLNRVEAGKTPVSKTLALLADAIRQGYEPSSSSARP